MTVEKKAEGTTLQLRIVGRLDTNTTPQLEAVLKQSLDGVTELDFDFAETEYLSSAGLRALMSAQRVMDCQGSMTVSHVNKAIMEVLEVTGFTAILTIQ